MAKQEIFLKDYKVPAYLFETVDLTFNFSDDEKTIVRAVYKIKKNPESTEANTLVLKADEVELTSIRLNDNILTDREYSFDGEVFTLENAPEEFTFEVNNLIDPANNTHLMGVYRSNGMFCSQCEAEGFRRITLHPDRPDILSEFTTTIIADKKAYPILLSNGNKVEEKDLEGGLHMVKWHDPHKKPCYLFAIVAGDLEYIADTFKTMSGREVSLKVFTDKQNISKAGFAMNSLIKSMKWDEEAFGREYDLDDFMIVAVDAFNFGAMENKGLNIFNSSAVLSTPETSRDDQLEYIQAVVGHEYFHNWSGNRVTCRDWFQLSLKEGFTVFRDSKFSTDMTQGVRKRIDDAKTIKALQFAEDSSPMSHPVQPQSYQEVDNFYTLTVYEKGCEVVRMYQTLLGNEGFRKGTDLYFDTFDGHAATIQDFRGSMEKANGVDLSQFHNWYTQKGTPTIKVEESYNQETKTYSLKLIQVIKEGQKAFLIPVKFGLLDKDGNDINSENMLTLNEMVHTFEFKNIDEKPVLSILRDFSAPVKIDFEQSEEEVKFLAENDNDLYNRYEAIQRVFTKQVENAIEDLRQGYEVAVFKDVIDVFKTTLTDESIDIAVLASYLQLPLKQTLEEIIQPVDPVLMDNALREIKNIVAYELHDDFLAIFKKYYDPKKTYEFTEFEINRRALVLTCLGYIYNANQEGCTELVQELFEKANNMTHESAAFKLLLDSDNEVVRNNAIEAFYEKWSNDNIVVDSWFTSQAINRKVCDSTFFNKLMENEKFNLHQPNKVRAVVAGFTQNPNFHCAEGYKALADLTIKIDDINPHMSSALVRKLMSYKK
ncbi:MAG TPA: aminopeptidase N, partial [Alphaproteobacteria bacterium]|nr:aminopeptidase N [Alphaproteobacteria bacterium]